MTSLKSNTTTLGSHLNILAIEDNPGDLFLLKEMLNDQNDYPAKLIHLVSSSSISEGLGQLEQKKFDIILLDLSLPDSKGIESLKRLAAIEMKVPVIVLTGLDDIELTKKALNEGAQDYLIKGSFSPSALLRTILSSIERRSFLRKIQDFNQKLEATVEERTNQLAQALKDMTRLMYSTVSVLEKLVEIRDSYTAGHQTRVAELALLIGKELSLSDSRSLELKYASLLHDIGKIEIPAEILNKPGKLTDIEFQMIKQHPTTAFEILKTVDFQGPVAEIVYQHHERLDGSGYPRGLTGKDMLLEAKILAVADTVEAVSSHRPYRPALGMEKALEIITEEKGSHYDPQVVEACKKIILEKSFEFSK